MKRRPRILSIVLLAVITLLVAIGCEDGVRQTIAPYIFTGLQTIASGLIAGLEQQVYPKGSTSTSQTVTSNSTTTMPTPTPSV